MGKKIKDTKGGQIIGALLKTVISKVVPGGAILENFMSDNKQPEGTYDKTRTKNDVILEIVKLVLWIVVWYLVSQGVLTGEPPPLGM